MADPIIPKGTKVEVADGSYTVRHLSVESVFRLANILNHVIDVVPTEVLANLEDSNAGIILLARGIPVAEDDFYAVLAQVLDFIECAGQFPTDEEKAAGAAKARQIPAVHLSKILKAVMEQEDFKDLFFGQKSLIEKATSGLSKREEAASP